MKRAVVLALAVLCFNELACIDDGNGPPVTGTTGTAGTTGTGGESGTFMAVAPCSTESSYTQGATTITFGAAADISYMPKCLKVSPGATVTFSGDFVTHPLSPSSIRGALVGNPITAVSSGTSKAFTFPNAGYYAYYCTVHGASDGAAGMVGVVWVQ